MRNEVRKLDFSGQDIYCGLDVHKRSWRMTACTDHAVVKTVSIENPFVKHIKTYLEKKFPGGSYHAAYEAGFSGFWAQRALSEAGIHTIVVHPADIPTTHKERDQKTDKRDSFKIATSLRSGELKGIYIPTEQAIKDRNIVRQRDRVAKDHRRVKNYIKSHLMFVGIDIPGDLDTRHWSARFVKWLKQIQLIYKDKTLALLLDRLAIIRKHQLNAVQALRELSKCSGCRAIDSYDPHRGNY
ncbi:MAG: transposase [Saprospiraceae bacterium]|nr:transposase [Saprospiraceae bacterium]